MAASDRGLETVVGAAARPRQVSAELGRHLRGAWAESRLGFFGLDRRLGARNGGLDHRFSARRLGDRGRFRRRLRGRPAEPPTQRAAGPPRRAGYDIGVHDSPRRPVRALQAVSTRPCKHRLHDGSIGGDIHAVGDRLFGRGFGQPGSRPSSIAANVAISRNRWRFRGTVSAVAVRAYMASRFSVRVQRVIHHQAAPDPWPRRRTGPRGAKPGRRERGAGFRASRGSRFQGRRTWRSPARIVRRNISRHTISQVRKCS